MATPIKNIDQLTADIDRWFNHSPYGIVLEGDNGEMWRLTNEKAAELRQLALDDIQSFVTWQSRRQALALVMLLALALNFDTLANWATAVAMPWLMMPVGLVCFAPVMPFVWGALFRARQRALRRNFVKSLDRAVPINPDMVARYVADTRFAGVARWIIFGMLVILLAVESFAARTIDALIGESGLAIFTACGLVLALVFYLLEIAGRRGLRP